MISPCDFSPGSWSRSCRFDRTACLRDGRFPPSSSYLQSERGLSIAGMYIQSRLHQTRTIRLHTQLLALVFCRQDSEESPRSVPAIKRKVYQSPACIYKADSIKGLSIAGMYIQSRQHRRSINRRHVYIQTASISRAYTKRRPYLKPCIKPPADRL